MTDFLALPTFAGPDAIRVVVESPKGSALKLKVEQTNPKSGDRERNDRIAVLPTNAPRWDSVHTVLDFVGRVRVELEQFFLATVAFERRELKLLGWGGPEDAMTLVRASQTHSEMSHA